MKELLETSDTIHEGLIKLTLLAKRSAAKGDGRHQLNTFKTISKAVDNIGTLQTLNSSQILACVKLLKMIVALQQAMVKSKDISPKEIPTLYSITHTLNTLFVKSSKDAISSGNTATITEQCDALFQAINYLRSDASLRTCGILDAKLKDAAGKLREKADIMNLFQGKDSHLFEKVISSAEKELEEKDLARIGETYAKLDNLNAKFKQKYPLKSNMTNYLVKYRDTFLEKIKERINELKQESAKGSLSHCRELVEQMTELDGLRQFHGEASMDRQIRVLRNKMLNEKIIPLESVLKETAQFIRSRENDHFTMGYQEQYRKAHNEDEIFTTAFYRRTLEELEPCKAVSLLKEKQHKMNRVDIQKAGQADYEGKLRKKIGTLIRAFDPSVDRKN